MSDETPTLYNTLVSVFATRMDPGPHHEMLVHEWEDDRGKWRIRLNPTKKLIDDLEPFRCVLERPDFFPEIVAVVDPRGGLVFGGESEDDLIARVRTQHLHPPHD